MLWSPFQSRDVYLVPMAMRSTIETIRQKIPLCYGRKKRIRGASKKMLGGGGGEKTRLQKRIELGKGNLMIIS